eukprot:TRINITY_DN32504_c0_g1_i1.p3 TRINITY_DN32504_c0_g1~~TRINITY_DN32504_c0_g1_i1.p3  ORF type:complete len:139 (+),score=1.85 TRINITY_DN32504_c0_g1_i1:419-835(+)
MMVIVLMFLLKKKLLILEVVQDVIKDYEKKYVLVNVIDVKLVTIYKQENNQMEWLLFLFKILKIVLIIQNLVFGVHVHIFHIVRFIMKFVKVMEKILPVLNVNYKRNNLREEQVWIFIQHQNVVAFHISNLLFMQKTH